MVIVSKVSASVVMVCYYLRTITLDTLLHTNMVVHYRWITYDLSVARAISEWERAT